MLPNFNLILGGLMSALTFQNIFICFIGNLIGILFGAMPGLTGSLAIAVLIPVTFGMDPINGLLLVASAYCGAMFGGSISAILINTPGTVAAAATCLDGYPMAKQGRGGEALGMAAYASFFGGIFSTLALLLFGPPIANLALKFGPSEYCALGLMGIVIIVSISMDSLVKGLISGVIGLLLGTVGADQIVGFGRFAFGSTYLLSGINLLAALIGLFSVSQIIILAEETGGQILEVNKISDKVLLSLKQLKGSLLPMLRGSIIGTLIGALPGAGATIATFLSYDINKRYSKNPEKYGTGFIEAVASCESANNGVTGGAFTTMLTLGIPGNEATAIMMGGLMILGLRPGPSFFVEGSNIAYGFIMGLLICNLIMLLLGLSVSKYFAKLVRCPNSVLVACIAVLCVIGTYAINNSMLDVLVMFIMGILGYLMKKAGFSPVPVVLGMILEPIIESNLHRSLLISKGGWSIFVTRPLTLLFLLITIVVVALPFIKQKGKSRKICEM
ncbi:MAG: tripartite tricarboxylate transporter permease [Peptococcaceae bacterium]